MQMRMIVSRSSLLDDLLALLASLGVDAPTPLPNVHGVGEAGATRGTIDSPASKAVVASAVEEDRAKRVVAELEASRNRSAARRPHGKRSVSCAAHPVLRVFVLPCTQAV